MNSPYFTVLCTHVPHVFVSTARFLPFSYLPCRVPINNIFVTVTRSCFYIETRQSLWCQLCRYWRTRARFLSLFGVSSDYAQPITGQVTEVTCPVIGRAQPEWDIQACSERAGLSVNSSQLLQTEVQRKRRLTSTEFTSWCHKVIFWGPNGLSVFNVALVT